MDNEKLNKEDLENSSVVTPDYISEVSDKKNNLSTLLDKFKNRRDQKLLGTGDNKKHVTNRSIASLWEEKSLLSAIFTSLDNMRKSISEKFSTPLPQNKLATEIIGKDSLDSKEDSLYKNSNDLEIQTSPIIKPVTKSSQISKNKKIKLAKINTSAIEKEQDISDKEQTQDNSISSGKTEFTEISLEQTPVEGHER